MNRTALYSSALLLTCGIPAFANPAYTITDLGTLGGANSFGAGINDSGEITGTADLNGVPVQHAFLYDGVMRDLGTLGGTNSFGTGINNSGEVTGAWYIAGDVFEHAFAFNGTTMVDIGTLGGTNSQGAGINDTGEVTGQSPTAAGVPHAFLYNGTRMIDIGTLGGTHSVGQGINASAEVTGASLTTGDARFHAFLYNGSTMLDLGTFGGTSNGTGEDSAGYGINAIGEVTGFSTTPIGGGVVAQHAFLYNGGKMLDLGTLGGTSSNGLSVNAAGEVVGYSGIGGGGTDAFLYSNGTMLDLNTLITPTDPLYGKISLNEATGINNRGQIVAAGCYTGGPLTGQCHAVRLDPVLLFAGTPGKASCYGQSVAALVQQYGGLNAAAAALGFPSVRALQNAILAFCGG